MKKIFTNKTFSLDKCLLVLMLYSYTRLAMSAPMPWEGPLCGLSKAFQGPTAVAISTIAFFAAGVSFLWGEEIAGISKKLITIFMAICIILGGVSLVGWIASHMGGITIPQCAP